MKEEKYKKRMNNFFFRTENCREKIYNAIRQEENKMTVFEDLKWRGLIKDISSPELEEKLIVEVSNAYIYNLAISQELEAKLYLN